MVRFTTVAAFLALLTLPLIGCDTATGPGSGTLDETDNTYQPTTVIGDEAPDGLRVGVFTVCKAAPDDPDRSFTFDVSAEGPNIDAATITSTIDLTDGACEDIYEISGSLSGSDDVTVTENVPSGWDLDGITVYQINDEGTVATYDADGPSITDQITPGIRGVLATYRNVQTATGDDGNGNGDDGNGDDGNGDDGNGDDGDGDDGADNIGGEGCTPGAWKNRLLRLERWPVADETPVSDVWSVPSEIESATLLDALHFGGGPTFTDKVRILLRAATAAYLNAHTIEYDLTAQEIVDKVEAAIASGDADAVIALAEELDRFNNQDCPITERNYDG